LRASPEIEKIMYRYGYVLRKSTFPKLGWDGKMKNSYKSICIRQGTLKSSVEVGSGSVFAEIWLCGSGSGSMEIDQN
jgi:hypothetical protein